MKKNILVATISLIVVGTAVGGGYLFGKSSSSTTNPKASSGKTNESKTPQQKSTTPDTSSATPTAVKPTINTYDPAGLFNASETRKLTDFTAWQDSPVTVSYADYNGDGISDAFVWAKLPGTKGFSFAAVWTLDTNNQPKELWHVPSAEQFVQSSWTFSGTTFTEKGSIESPNGLDPQTNTYHWQGSTFVTS